MTKKDTKTNIKMKLTSIPYTEENGTKRKLSYKDLIKSSFQLNEAVEKGFSVEKMRTMIRLSDLLDEAKDDSYIEVDNVDLPFIKERVKMKDGYYPFFHRDLIEFHEYIENL